MRHFKTVLKFEYLSVVLSKPFWITTVLILALLIGACNIPNIAGVFNTITGNENPGVSDNVVTGAKPTGVSDNADVPPDKKAALYDPEGVYTDEVLQTYAPQYAWERLADNDTETVKKAVESGQYAIALAVDGLNYTVTQPGTEFMRGLSLGIDEMIKNTYQTNALLKAGLSDAEIDTILTAAPTAELISVGKDITQTYWLGYALLMALYMAILLYGQQVMLSVVTEKTSKAMELLITSTKPVYLIFGKVIGVGLAGLTQFILIIGATIITLGFTRGAWTEFSPAAAAVLNLSTNMGTFLYAIVFFLLGFFIFAFIYAAFASTVSRAEDANSVAMFPILLFVSAFLVSILSLSNAGADYVTVCSFVPFLSPLVMFTRICVTDVPLVQILLSIMINIATMIAAGILSAKIYRTGVMLYGKTPKIKDIFKYMLKS